MATAPKSWTLFWLLALAISIANGVNIAYSNFSTFEGAGRGGANHSLEERARVEYSKRIGGLLL
jgi:hypothetical protein